MGLKYLKTLLLVSVLAVSVLVVALFLNNRTTETRSSAEGDFSNVDVSLGSKQDSDGFIPLYINTNGEILKEADIIIEHSEGSEINVNLSSELSEFDGNFYGEIVDNLHYKLKLINNAGWSANGELVKVGVISLSTDTLVLKIDENSKVVNSADKLQSLNQQSIARSYTYSKNEIKLTKTVTSTSNSQCKKKCADYQYRCGQSDGCGGKCSDLDNTCSNVLCTNKGINLCGNKCEGKLCDTTKTNNSKCVSNCGSYTYRCGQTDGCGGVCSNADDICPTYSCYKGGSNVCGRKCNATACN